jgi:hypothetical protein
LERVKQETQPVASLALMARDQRERTGTKKQTLDIKRRRNEKEMQKTRKREGNVLKKIKKLYLSI